MTSTIDHVPKLSVIVPVYNTRTRLKACLDSLLAQKMRDFELLLIDDGSSDGSLEVCREYAGEDRRIRLFSGRNKGVSHARNTGLEHARGEWIAFCDSDDVTDPDLYGTLIETALGDRAELSCCALIDNGPEEIKAVTNFPFKGRALLSGRDEVLRCFLLPLLTDSPSVHGYLVTCLFRRDIIDAEKIRFDLRVSMKEDTLFLAEYLLCVERVSGTDRPLYNYMRFHQSACTKYYRSKDSFYREKNWYHMACGRFRVFMKGGLDRVFPEMIPGFFLRVYLHRAQMICCMPGISRRWKNLRLKVVRRNAAGAGALFRRGPGVLFRLGLFYSLPFLKLILFLKRRKDAAVRIAEHLGDRLK